MTRPSSQPRSADQSAHKRWRQLVGLFTTALTCVFGFGAFEELPELNASEDRGELAAHARGEVDGSPNLDSASESQEDERSFDAGIRVPPHLGELSDFAHIGDLLVPRPFDTPAVAYGPPIYRIAPSHSPPAV